MIKQAIKLYENYSLENYPMQIIYRIYYNETKLC